MRRALLLVLLAACGKTPAASLSPIHHAISLLVLHPALVNVAGDSLQLAAHVTDSHGEDPGVAVVFSAAPATLATQASQDGQTATFTLAGRGSVTFHACLADAPSTCASAVVVIDDGQPVLTVTDPAPGAELDDPAGVVVRGSAMDGSGSLSIFVNGQLASQAEDGSFAVTLPPQAGFQHVEVVASDGLTSERAVEMDVLHAASFQAPVEGAFQLDSGIPVRLGQDLFDDGVPAAGKTAGDMADLLTLALAGIDLPLPDPVIDDPALTLHVKLADRGQPQVFLTVVEGGLDLYLRLSGLRLDTSGRLSLAGKDRDLAGRIEGSVVAHALVTLKKADRASPIESTVGDVEVDLDGLTTSFADPQVAAVFTLAEGALRSTLEGQLRSSVGALLTADLPALPAALLDPLDKLLASRTMNVNTPPLAPVTLQLDGRIGSLDAVEGVGIDAPLSVRVASASTDLHPGSRGLAILEPAGDLRNAGHLQLGASLPLLNAMLHELWSAGLFDIDLVKAVPEVGALASKAVLVPRLPLLLRPARPGETHDLVLSLAQAELTGEVGSAPIHFGVNLDAGVDVSTADGNLTLTVSDKPSIHAWPIEDPTASGIDTDQIAFAIGYAWPQIARGLGNLSVPLALPAPPDLTSISPALAGLTLQLVPQGQPLLRGDLLVVDVALSATVP